MAKCSRCGRKGLFFKVGKDGLCDNCTRLINLETTEAHLQESIQKLQENLKDQTKMYEDVLAPLREIATRQVDEELALKHGELAECIATLSEKYVALEEVTKKLEKSEKTLNTNNNRVQKLKASYEAMNHAIELYRNSELTDANIDLILEKSGQDIYSPTVELNLHCMDVKTLRKLYKQNEREIELVLHAYEGRYTTKANATIYRLMVIALKAELQNILYSINYGKMETAVDNVKTVTAKYFKIATDGNKSIASTMVKFIGEIEYLFIEAVKIEYEYFVQKERIKEEQRALREQMKQEAEERRMLEQQRKQVEREESKYQTEISNITEQLLSTEDEEKVTQLQRRIEELTAQLSAVKTKKEEITNLQNGKAGYVYVISNLGSFGDKVFKIGMTRRLEPQERVDELGNASVPFPFDVHSFIFSEDAVGLENKLHKILNDNRVNKINLRKEFFNITVDELEELVFKIEPSASFKKTMLAEQYKQSLSIDKVPDETIPSNVDDEELVEVN